MACNIQRTCTVAVRLTDAPLPFDAIVLYWPHSSLSSLSLASTSLLSDSGPGWKNIVTGDGEGRVRGGGSD